MILRLKTRESRSLPGLLSASLPLPSQSSPASQTHTNSPAHRGAVCVRATQSHNQSRKTQLHKTQQSEGAAGEGASAGPRPQSPSPSPAGGRGAGRDGRHPHSAPAAARQWSIASVRANERRSRRRVQRPIQTDCYLMLRSGTAAGVRTSREPFMTESSQGAGMARREPERLSPASPLTTPLR